MANSGAEAVLAHTILQMHHTGRAGGGQQVGTGFLQVASLLVMLDPDYKNKPVEQNNAWDFLKKLDKNIHAGTKYLRFIVDRYFNDKQMNDVNKMLFAFASYNAGPARVSNLRAKAIKMGLDPNVWFHNVEVVAAKVVDEGPIVTAAGVSSGIDLGLHLLERWFGHDARERAASGLDGPWR